MAENSEILEFGVLVAVVLYVDIVQINMIVLLLILKNIVTMEKKEEG